MTRKLGLAGVVMACVVAAQAWMPLRAEDRTAEGTKPMQDLDEVVVTARKREESILKVPVVETAIPEAKLERLQVTDFSDLPKLVPGLNLGNNILTIGTMISIR